MKGEPLPGDGKCMMNEPRHRWATACAAQILNLGYLDSGEPKAIQFQRLVSVIYDTLRLSDMESRESMLTPSNN